MQDVGDARERVELDRETLDLAVAHGDVAIQIRARQRLVFDHVSLGDPTAADGELAALEALVLDLPARLKWPVALQRAMRALCEARFDDVDAHVASARALLGDRADTAVRRCLALRAYFEALLRDRGDAIGARWAEAAPTFHQRPLPELCLALVHARAGRTDEARASLLGASREALLAFAADPPTSLLLAEVIDAVGDASLAEAVTPRVEPIAGRIAVWSWLAMTCLGPTERALGLLARARGRLDEAEGWFAKAEERAERGGLALHLPRIQYERGVTLLARRDHDRGLACLDRAQAMCERLGLPELAARIVAARAPGGPPPPPQAPLQERIELRREGELWVLSRAEESHRLKDSRGMQLLARLVSMPEKEVHVLDLLGDSEGPIDIGDAGELIDARARDAYRRRVSDLRVEIADAEGANDRGRAERARAELEQIEAELVSAVGLGGRSRRAPSATERARSNVQRRISEAVRRIHEASPAIGRHLEHCVRTGIYCRYSPTNPRT
jgi:tetratricopeptide (TPR) repeat protein